MDSLLQPIKSVRPSGLQIITVRTGHKGLMAGQIRLNVGAVHAVKIDPRWEGLSHFTEHMRAVGASRKYGPDELNNIIGPQLYFRPNALTNIYAGNYFSTFGSDGGVVGQVLPTRNFWQAFNATVDGVFFPKFDVPTMERERLRIINEIKDNMTSLRLDNARFWTQLYGVDYVGVANLGTKEQVESYTQDDCVAFQEMTCTLKNTCVTVTGDVVHANVVEQVEVALADVSHAGIDLSTLEKSRVQNGEFRRHQDGVNEGLVNTALYFPAVNMAENEFYPSSLAVNGLSKIIEEKVQSKFGLYSAGAGYDAFLSIVPSILLYLTTGQKDIASDALAYTIEIMHDPETHALIAERHNNLVGQSINYLEINQSTVEQQANRINDINSIGASLLSPDEAIERYRNTTPDQVAQVIRELISAPAFLNVRGHPDALDSIPSIDTINAWRSTPSRPDSSAVAIEPSTPPPVSAPHPR